MISFWISVVPPKIDRTQLGSTGLTTLVAQSSLARNLHWLLSPSLSLVI
jgi:hypothetical protein